MDFLLTDSVLHLKDGEMGQAGIFSRMRLDVGIPSHIYYWANDTRRICASAKKNTEKQKKEIRQSKMVQRKVQENNYKLGEGSIYSLRAGFDYLKF